MIQIAQSDSPLGCASPYTLHKKLAGLNLNDKYYDKNDRAKRVNEQNTSISIYSFFYSLQAHIGIYHI